MLHDQRQKFEDRVKPIPCEPWQLFNTVYSSPWKPTDMEGRSSVTPSFSHNLPSVPMCCHVNYLRIMMHVERLFRNQTKHRFLLPLHLLLLVDWMRNLHTWNTFVVEKVSCLLSLLSRYVESHSDTKVEFPWIPFFHKIARQFGHDRFAICYLLLGAEECFKHEDDNPSDSQSQALKNVLRWWYDDSYGCDNELLQKLLQALYESGCAASTLGPLITGGEFPVSVAQSTYDVCRGQFQ